MFMKALIHDTRRMTNKLARTPPNSITNNDLCECVGMESLILFGLAQAKRREMHKLHEEEIFEEQKRQCMFGLYDSDRFAFISEMSSEETCDRAHMLASSIGDL